jgi:hypothetical protein
MFFVLLIGLTALWVLIDAKSIGVRKGLITGMGNMGPWAWFFGCLVIWIIAFPLYLAKRGDFKRAIANFSQAATGSGHIEQLERLAQLKEKGAITADEFETQKKQLLSTAAATPQVAPQAGTPWLTIIFFVVVAGLAVAWFAGSADRDAKKLEELAKAQPSGLRPDGELSEIFAIGGKYTDLQRENKLKEIKGQVIAWRLPVYEVSRSGDSYRVQTETSVRIGPIGTDLIGAFVDITPRNDDERRELEALKTGDAITFKGRIADVTLRHLEIRPAILLAEGSSGQPLAAAKGADAPASKDDKAGAPTTQGGPQTNVPNLQTTGTLDGVYWCNETKDASATTGNLMAFFPDGIYTENYTSIEGGQSKNISLTFGRYSIAGDRLTVTKLGVTNQTPIQMETIQRASMIFEQRIVKNDEAELVTRGVKTISGSDVYNLPGDFALQCVSKNALGQEFKDKFKDQRAMIPTAALQ